MLAEQPACKVAHVRPYRSARIDVVNQRGLAVKNV